MQCQPATVLSNEEGSIVPKLINVNQPQHTTQQALEYVKMHILMPSGFLGLLCLIGGVGGLVYQWFATDTYTWDTFYESSGLFLSGIGLGAGHTVYQRYLFREFPEVLAARMRQRLERMKGRLKKRSEPADFDHPGSTVGSVRVYCRFHTPGGELHCRLRLWKGAQCSRDVPALGRILLGKIVLMAEGDHRTKREDMRPYRFLERVPLG